MKNLFIFLTLVLTSVAFSQVVIPSGWGTCGAFWASKCARFCLATGRTMNFCWIDRSWTRAGSLVGASGAYPYVRSSIYLNRLPDRNYVRAAYPYDTRRYGVGAIDYGHTRFGVRAYPNVYRKGVDRYRPRRFVRRPYRSVGARDYTIDRVRSARSRVNRAHVRGNVRAVRRNVGAARGLKGRAFLQTEVKNIIRVWKYAKHVNCNCI
jgi:hypothetical protein